MLQIADRPSCLTYCCITLNVAAVSAAGASSARRGLTCSASSPEGQTRVAYLKKAGLAVAASAVASAVVPVVALAEEAKDEVKVGEEVTTQTGLKYVVTVAGKGAKPNAGNTIKAHYTGELYGYRLDLELL